MQVYQNDTDHHIHFYLIGNTLYILINIGLNSSFTGGYLTFTTDRKILKTASNIDPRTVYVHMYTRKNNQQNHAK